MRNTRQQGAGLRIDPFHCDLTVVTPKPERLLLKSPDRRAWFIAAEGASEAIAGPRVCFVAASTAIIVAPFATAPAQVGRG